MTYDSIVDVQDWLLALFGVLEVTSLAKVGNFQIFARTLANDHRNRIYGVKKIIFFLLLSFLLQKKK